MKLIARMFERLFLASEYDCEMDRRYLALGLEPLKHYPQPGSRKYNELRKQRHNA